MFVESSKPRPRIWPDDASPEVGAGNPAPGVRRSFDGFPSREGEPREPNAPSDGIPPKDRTRAETTRETRICALSSVEPRLGSPRAPHCRRCARAERLDSICRGPSTRDPLPYTCPREGATRRRTGRGAFYRRTRIARAGRIPRLLRVERRRALASPAAFTCAFFASRFDRSPCEGDPTNTPASLASDAWRGSTPSGPAMQRSTTDSNAPQRRRRLLRPKTFAE